MNKIRNTAVVACAAIGLMLAPAIAEASPTPGVVAQAPTVTATTSSRLALPCSSYAIGGLFGFMIGTLTGDCGPVPARSSNRGWPWPW